MQWILSISLLVCLLFFGCEEYQVERISLDRAEALVETQADSAQALLDSIDTPDKLDDSLFARWCMLRAKVSDKLSEDMPYVEQLQRAQGWYQSHGTTEEQAWIGLYLGRSYVEDKLFIPATNTYSDALEIALEGKAYNAAGYICSYMGDLYEYTHQISEARRKYEEAAKYFEKAGNKRSYALAWRNIGKTYYLNNRDSIALNYILKADSIIKKVGTIKEQEEIYNNLGNLYAAMGNIDKAKSSYLKSISSDSLVNAPTYLALSHLFYDNNNLDSAKYYLRKSNFPSYNEYTAIDRLYIGYLIDKKGGNIANALKYLEEYIDSKDFLYDKNKQVDIIDAEKRHNISTLLLHNSQLKSEKYFYSTIAGVILIVFLVVCWIYQIKDKNKLKIINQQQDKLKEKEYQLNRLKLEIREKNIQLIDKTKLEKEIDKINTEIIMLRNNIFQSSSIVKKIRKILASAITPGKKCDFSTKDIKSLTALIASVYPNTERFFYSESNILTDADMAICCLSFLRLDIKEEALLLNINPESVSKRRLRIRQKLGLVNTDTRINDYIVTRCRNNSAHG